MKIIHEIYALIIKELEKNYESILLEGKDISEFVVEMQKNLNKVGVQIMKHALETLDEDIKNIKERKELWHVKENNCKNTLDTIFGRVEYSRTYYKNKIDGEYKYLSDELVGISPSDKMDISLKSKLVNNATDLSYRKSGKAATPALQVTGQSVMNSIRELDDKRDFIAPFKEVNKSVNKLFIEVDEDHVSLQNGKGIMPRLAYVHEGLELEGNSNSRYRLVNPRFFGGVYKEIDDLWEEIVEYIGEQYEFNNIDKIYLSGDGASYIKSGRSWFGSKCTYVFDNFHISKYIKKATRHVSGGERRVWKAIKDKDGDYLEALLNTYEGEVTDAKMEKRVVDANKVILGHFEDILPQFNKDYVGCSAEGHISHIYAARLSSRPLGWSETGADQMARLRVFVANGGDIMKLMLQKKYREKAKNEIFPIEAKIQSNTIRKKHTGYEGINNLPALTRGKCDGTYAAIKLIQRKTIA